MIPPAGGVLPPRSGKPDHKALAPMVRERKEIGTKVVKEIETKETKCEMKKVIENKKEEVIENKKEEKGEPLERRE